jgi:hypothetical protein
LGTRLQRRHFPEWPTNQKGYAISFPVPLRSYNINTYAVFP